MTKGQDEADSLVFVVDDDASMRQAVTSLLQSVDLRVEAFGSAADFLKKGRIATGITAACLILDIRLPGVSGLDFQAELAKADIHLPIIFISGHGDIPMTVRAMKAGAIEFLTKPFRDQDLLDAVQLGLQRDRDRRIRESAVLQTRTRFEALTPREQEVFGLVTTGLMNKQVAGELGVSEITAKVHRGNVIGRWAPVH
jgi:FixJ family two-component response regulator